MKSDSVDKRVAYYGQRSRDIASGKVKPVPFFGLPALTNYIPGIIPGLMYKITSHSGMGKTQFTKFAFVYQTIIYAIKYNINLRILYFALEESEEMFIDGLFLHILQRQHKITVDRFSLAGMNKTPLTQEELDAIDAAKKNVTLMMSYIEVIDDCYKPDEIFNRCKKAARKYGKLEIIKEGTVDEEEVYTPNDPSQLVEVIVDHVSLIAEQYDFESKLYLNQAKSMSKWHTEYCMKIICKKWKWTGINIQQQTLESEKQQFTMKGDSIINKILPTLEGVANNKEIIRDDYIVLGLFSPDRYEIKNYRGYNIREDADGFRDNFRTLHVLKNRLGTPNKILPLYFDGKYTFFKELPMSDNPGKLKTEIEEFMKKIN